MKKKIIGMVAIMVITATTVFNINLNTQKEIPAITLKNIEALADAESPGYIHGMKLGSSRRMVSLTDPLTGYQYYLEIEVQCCLFATIEDFCNKSEQSMHC